MPSLESHFSAGLGRYCLWIIGNASTLSNSDSVWGKVVLDAKKKVCFHNADDDKQLARAIEDALLELELLDKFETPFKKLSLGNKPETGVISSSGYVVWVSSALGPYWGFQQGWMKWLSGVIDNALYPVLFLDYLKSGIPAVGGGLPRVVATWGLTILLTYLNYKGLTIVGGIGVCLEIFSLLPFVAMGLLAIPDLEPSRWAVTNLNDVDWNLYLNTLFWNLNYWDSISTLSGEVENPKKTLPKALFFALILVVLSYFFPLLVGTGVVPVNRQLWTDGYFSDI
ncbi:probable polyamine transporter At1g31830 [Gastrolobium bilobum]|uniref:probable polyamine transporter At1g31830 n=1 Tax=Gastrolobium bilobum TaxID=150636 RepID=UPI002AB197CF|nr:probable polyamine transporter At1g31830 [Gastrolobium bilobum]